MGHPEPAVSKKEPAIENVKEINELNQLENLINKLRDLGWSAEALRAFVEIQRNLPTLKTRPNITIKSRTKRRNALSDDLISKINILLNKPFPYNQNEGDE